VINCLKKEDDRNREPVLVGNPVEGNRIQEGNTGSHKIALLRLFIRGYVGEGFSIQQRVDGKADSLVSLSS
jgi:hypothetical protein